MSSILSELQSSYQRYIVSQATPAIIYVACSGGRDSMALLQACLLLDLPIHVIHVNHKLQAPSDSWQKLVEDFCKQRQLPYTSVHLNWQDKSLVHVNEQQARTARYQAIVAATGKNATIALAHHANDQAETLLMNLCQGTGLAGLSGMAEFCRQDEFELPIYLWRPLLAVTRDEISEFVQEQQVPYVDDPTNLVDGNQRAFLRNQVLPLLKQRFGKVVENINRTQHNLSDAKLTIDEQIQQDIAICELAQGWTIHQRRLDIKQLLELSQARRFGLLHRWIKGQKKFAPSRQLIEQVEQLILSENTEQQTILQWQGLHIRRYRQILYRLDTEYVQVLRQGTESIAVDFSEDNQVLASARHITELQYRSVIPNESFQRWNADCHQTLKKLCQAYNIPSWERQLAKVVSYQDNTAHGVRELKVALVLPSQSFWLKEASHLDIDTSLTCHWQLDIAKLVDMSLPSGKTLN